MRFEGKVALVTGGSSGIGAETCVRLAEEGAQVAVVASSSLDRAQATVDRCGGNAKPFACDVSDVAQVDKLVADVIEEFGRIDILVNSAGVFFPTRVGETDEGDVRSRCATPISRAASSCATRVGPTDDPARRWRQDR